MPTDPSDSRKRRGMAERPLNIAERRERMLTLILARSSCSVAELAQEFSVTPATIRSDLAHLEQERLVTRTHGGVVARAGVDREKVLADRGEGAVKARIAEKALELVENGDSLSIDTGTTAIAFAHALAQSSLTGLKVISSDLTVLSLLETRDDFETIAIGGRVRPGFHFACGGITLAALDYFSVEKCFVSTTCIDIREGLTTPNVDTAQLKAKYLSIGHASALLVDSTKFGRVSFSKFADLDQIDHVVVDDGIRPAITQELRRHKCDVLIA